MLRSKIKQLPLLLFILVAFFNSCQCPGGKGGPGKAGPGKAGPGKAGPGKAGPAKPAPVAPVAPQQPPPSAKLTLTITSTTTSTTTSRPKPTKEPKTSTRPTTTKTTTAVPTTSTTRTTTTDTTTTTTSETPSTTKMTAGTLVIPVQDVSEKKIAAREQSTSQIVQKTLFPVTRGDAIAAADVLAKCKDFSPTRAAPPPSKSGEITYVNVTFAVNRFLDIDTVSETISVAGAMVLSWSISTCPINTTDEFAERPPEPVFVTKSNDVWTPAYLFVHATSNIFMQSTDDFEDDLVAASSHTFGSPNRTIDFYWVKDGVFVSRCLLDLHQFPFDKQSCVLTFSLMRSSDKVTFQGTPGFLWPREGEGSLEWDYVDRGVNFGIMYYRGMGTTALHFSITMKRNPWYYITNLILPNAVLGVVQLGSYILPPNVPDRPVFSVTILLAMTVAQSNVNAEVPKTSQRILLVDYLAGLSWICAGATLYQMAVCWYASKADGDEKITLSLGQRLRIGRVVVILDLAATFLSVGAFIGLNAFLYVMAK